MSKGLISDSHHSDTRVSHVSSILFALVGIVLFHVSLQSAGLCAGVVALFAGKRFLTAMGENVPPQVAGLCAFVVAPFARKRFITSVGEQVPL